MYKYIIIDLLYLIPLQVIAAVSPTVSELLDKYAETQNKLKSFIIKSETSADIDESYAWPGWAQHSGKKKG